MKKPRPISSYVREADKLFADYIKRRDGGCIVEGHPRVPSHGGPLQCAHIVSRRKYGIRWDPDNALTLCRDHHVYYTHQPHEWFLQIEADFPRRLTELTRRDLAHKPFRVPYYRDILLPELRQKLSTLEEAS